METCALYSHFSLIIVCFLSDASALPIYTFYLGQNASIEFHHELRGGYSSYSFEIFTLDAAHPFYTNGKVDPGNLNPSQGDRFEVRNNLMGNNLTIYLHIQGVEEIDNTVYIVSLREGNGGHFINHIYDAYIDVILPPGKAECDVRFSRYSSHLREVHCQATIADDGDGRGLLACYQNSAKASYLQPVRHDGTQVTAIFWMSAKSPIKCCSFATNFEKDPNSCTDFVFELARVSTTDPTTIQTATKSEYSTAMSASYQRSNKLSHELIDSTYSPNREQYSGSHNVVLLYYIVPLLPITVLLVWLCYVRKNKLSKFIKSTSR